MLHVRERGGGPRELRAGDREPGVGDDGAVGRGGDADGELRGEPPHREAVLSRETQPTTPCRSTQGVCSSSCKGSKADTVGVAEFDTVSGKFIGEHNSKANNGCVPFSSPDGGTIVLAPYDGGETVRVLKAGENGKTSVGAPVLVSRRALRSPFSVQRRARAFAHDAVLSAPPVLSPQTFGADVPVAMAGGTFGSQAISDVAFLQDGARNFLILAGSTDNDLVVVDMDDAYRFVKVRLSNNPEATAAGNRQVEWAVGTDYVWVNGGQTEEMYVVEIPGGIDSAKIVKTLSSVADGKGARRAATLTVAAASRCAVLNRASLSVTTQSSL